MIGVSAIETLFSCVLTTIRHERVKKYLLESSPASDLSILTSNKNLLHAYDGTVQNSFTESLQHQSPHLFGKTTRWVLLPAVNFNELSASVLIIEENKKISLDQPKHRFQNENQPRIQRIVQDSRDGTTLGLSIDLESKSVEVVFVKPNATHTSRKRMIFRVAWATFNHAITNTITVSKLITQLDLLVLTQESRMCRSCYYSMHPASICQNTQAYKTLYPFDFGAAVHNMMLNVGCFAGTYNATMFENVTTACSDTVQIVLLNDTQMDGMKKRLLSRAVSISISCGLGAALPAYTLNQPNELATTHHQPIQRELIDNIIGCCHQRRNSTEEQMQWGLISSLESILEDVTSVVKLNSKRISDADSRASVKNIDLTMRSIRPSLPTKPSRIMAGVSVATQDIRTSVRYRRILRNRLSAARSNGIKKKQLADLKSELKEWRNLKDEAIFRLNQLKDKNIYLRNTIKTLI